MSNRCTHHSAAVTILQAEYTCLGGTTRQLQPVLLHGDIMPGAWAARYTTWLLSILTLKDGVFALLFLRLVNSNILLYDALRLALLLSLARFRLYSWQTTPSCK